MMTETGAGRRPYATSASVHAWNAADLLDGALRSDDQRVRLEGLARARAELQAAVDCMVEDLARAGLVAGPEGLRDLDALLPGLEASEVWARYGRLVARPEPAIASG